jgi:hypothetical protein
LCGNDPDRVVGTGCETFRIIASGEPRRPAARPNVVHVIMNHKGDFPPRYRASFLPPLLHSAGTVAPRGPRRRDDLSRPVRGSNNVSWSRATAPTWDQGFANPSTTRQSMGRRTQGGPRDLAPEIIRVLAYQRLDRISKNVSDLKINDFFLPFTAFSIRSSSIFPRSRLDPHNITFKLSVYIVLFQNLRNEF